MSILKTPDVVTTLTRLGLTNNQAKAYFALVKLGEATAKKIAETSRITRQDIYRILPYLEEMGYVGKEISKPAIYYAIPLQETLQILIKQRGKETLDLKKQIGSIVENVYIYLTKDKLEQKKLETIFVPGKRTLLNTVQKSIKNMQKSLFCITTSNKITKHLSNVMDTNLFKQKNREDFKIQIITELSENVTTSPKIVKNKNFEHRFIQDPPQAHLLIIDEKEVFIKTSITGDFGEIPSIWSNNPCLLAISLNYFETLWKKSMKEN